ncbi:MAG: hypothetical protein HYX66_05235 [Ignavibacteria bacterium]|nr:hypothetical protein [Ignavibacteria bacterium]
MKSPSILRILYTVQAATFSILLSGCTGDSPATPAPLKVPESYDASTYSASTSDIYQLRDDYEALILKIKSGRDKSTIITYEELANLYAPLQPFTMPEFDPMVESLLQSAVSSSGKDFDPMSNPQNSSNGGVYGGYFFDKYGRCIDENFEKGMYAALLYNQANILISDGVSVTDIDKLIALFGASPLFPNTGNAAENADVFSAEYAAQRDKNDGKGFYSQIKKAFITAQAAAKAGDNYRDDLNASIATVKSVWERALMATAISYLYSTVSQLSATNLDAPARASAIHSFGEASGIVFGWRFLNSKQRIATDYQLAEILSLIKMPADQEPTIHLLWQQSFAELPKLETAIGRLQAIYGFSASDLEDFKTNWVNAQGRN